MTVLRWLTWGLVALLIITGVSVFSAAAQLLLLGVGAGVPASAQGGSLNVGDIVMRLSACGSGFTEVSALDAKTLLGTVAANMDVGGTGGDDTLTPAGTNSAPTFTGSALGTHLHGTGTYATSAHSGTAVTDHASHTHDYTQVVNHTHTVNVGSAADISSTTGAGNIFAGTTSSVVATSANPAGGVATGTTAGPSASLTHAVTQPSAHTLSGSSEAVSAGTPAGTVGAPTFTGDAGDNRSAFTFVIFCEKT